jgi:hypothetical protein
MKKKLFLFAILITLSTAGCLNSGSDSVQEGANNQANGGDAVSTDKDNKGSANPTESAGNAVSGLCANDYYPVDTASDYKYKVTGDVPGSYVLSQKSIDENSFTELRKFESGLDVKINWICTQDGLRTAEFNNTASMSKANFKMETLESTGITLPKEWSDGKSWEADYKIKANINAGPASGSASGTVKVTSKIISVDDKITVAGESTTAAKVDSVIKMNLKMGGRKIPTADVKMTNWYVKNTGLVRQSASTQFGKTGIEYVGKN